MSNCYKCGRFVGKDGNHDIGYDGYNGGYEQGYPTCGLHTRGSKKYIEANKESKI